MNPEFNNQEFFDQINTERERLKKELGNFWVGPDIEIDKPAIIPPESNIKTNLLFSKKCFPKDQKIGNETLYWLQKSVRSRFAQSGIEINLLGTDSLNFLTLEDVNKINNDEEIALPIRASNYSLRPVELNGGVLRLFWTDYENRLQGEELIKTIADNVAIDGKYKNDWILIDENGNDLENQFDQNAKMLRLFCKEEKLYLPTSNKILQINSKDDINQALKPIPNNLDPYFQIGETQKLTLSKNVVATIETSHYENARHLSSNLIDPGNDSPIRTEFIGVNHHDWIDLWIYKV